MVHKFLKILENSCSTGWHCYSLGIVIVLAFSMCFRPLSYKNPTASGGCTPRILLLFHYTLQPGYRIATAPEWISDCKFSTCIDWRTNFLSSNIAKLCTCMHAHACIKTCSIIILIPNHCLQAYIYASKESYVAIILCIELAAVYLTHNLLNNA